MTATSETGSRSRNLVLAAMIFAVAMTFIDQTIVAIAAPSFQKELGLTTTGVQWAVNAYILSLAAFFAFGGRLADTLGHRRMVVLGVIVFATASALCGLTPRGSIAEAWIVTFRVVQGAGGAIMFPAALAIVVQTFELRTRGRALALFFGIAGGLTAIGPLLGGYLTQWTWRAIFWVNIPVAVVALVLIIISKPTTTYRPARQDLRGLALIATGVALSVFGFQQSSIWGWGNPAIGLSIGLGVLIIGVFYLVELHTQSPLIQVKIFSIRAFRVENLVLGIAMLVFVPMFFFASEYAQISLDEPAKQAGLYLLYFFIGFAVASQIGGRVLDRRGAKRPVFDRLLPRSRGVRALGRATYEAQFRLPGLVRRDGRCWRGLDADSSEHGRGEPGFEALLRRGHRHHSDHPELLRQLGPRHPRHHPRFRAPLSRHGVADVTGSAPSFGSRGGIADLRVTGQSAVEVDLPASPISSASTLLTPRGASSMSWPGSWPWRQSWP